MNPFFLADGYKTSHAPMYPEGTTLVLDNFTPRSNKYAAFPNNGVIVFGTTMTFMQIHAAFEEFFFKRPFEEVKGEIESSYEAYLGTSFDASHIMSLHTQGYLPISVRALEEGTECPIGVPMLVLYNTNNKFYWLPNFLETIISTLLWKPSTSATISYNMKKLFTEWALKTDKENLGFVDFQGHDFSMRGMDSIGATVASGLGHAVSFSGSDSLPVIQGARMYYDSENPIMSVPATEHSVMCAGGKEDEIETFRRLMKVYPKGILSIVSDTWDLWKVCTEYLPTLKNEILARAGKIVIRPDSGDPVDIICGIPYKTLKSLYDFKGEIGDVIFVDNKFYKAANIIEEHLQGNEYSFKEVTYNSSELKGVIELLWDVFGGTTNAQGYKVLDLHIGAIYGDSITFDRAKQIFERLEAKGFASTNVVLGIGSFTYQFNTRDTFGFAMKATYVEINGEGRDIFKDPITDDGTKKSAKGLLGVFLVDGKITLKEGITWKEFLSNENLLKEIYSNGSFIRKESLTGIRNRINQKLKKELGY